MRYQSGFLFALLLSCPALATSPVCNSDPAKQGYNVGYNLQKNVIKYLWDQQFDSECNNMEQFIHAVNTSFSPSNYGGSIYLQCRDEGLVTGLTDAIADIQSTCAGYCIESGTTTGELFAKQFCGVVEAEGTAASLAQSINVCETFSVQGCRIALTNFVNRSSSCKAKADEDSAGFENFVNNIACPVPL